MILDRYEHEIKVGVTVRYLGGIGYLGLKGNNLNAQYKSGSDSLIASRSDLEFASNIISTKNAILNGVSDNNILSEFFGSKDGSGVGGDVGVVYDYMPEYSKANGNRDGKKYVNRAKNRYLLRISASVMDIGAITYNKNNNSNAEVTGNGVISGADFNNNVHNFDEFRTYAVSHGFTADTSHQNTKVYMPTTFHMSADYHAYSMLYVNATFIANLANRQNFGTSYYNQLTITPRYDTRLFSVGLPVTYGFLANEVKMGIGVRVSGFFIGSDDMLALFANHQSGFNVYVGGFVPFPKHKSKGQEVHNEADSTDMIPEPDSDHGGSSDSSDNCPDVPYELSHSNGKTNSKTVTGLTEGSKAEISPGDRVYIHEEMYKH